MATRTRGSMGARRQRRAGSRLARASLCVLFALGCSGPVHPIEVDGGTDDGGAAASVMLRVLPGTEPLGDGVVLERLTLGVATVRAPNDRGELVRDIGLLVDLTTGPAELMLTGAEPAVYGTAEVELASGAWGRALSLHVVEDALAFEVEIDEEIDLAPRCAAPVTLVAGGQLVFELYVPVQELVEALHEGPLPDPIDGVVHIDRATAPAVVDEIEQRLALARLDCDETDATDGH